MRKFFDYIKSENKGKRVDAILIPGDLLFWLSNYQEKAFVKDLKRDLEDLSYSLSAPICISYGNHDLPFNESGLSEEEKKEWDLANHIENTSEGIYVLNNEQKRFDDVVVTGFSPNRDAYATNAMPDVALDMAKETFDKCDFTFDKKDLNILMSHDNKFFTYEQITSQYDDLYDYITFIIGGHLHDGYMPLWLQSIFKNQLKDNRIWEKIPMGIDMCRGAFKVTSSKTSNVILPKRDEYTDMNLKNNETASIVNRGVAKYSWFIPSTPSMVTIEVIPENPKALSMKM
ncbi:MAG: metallophosphoesterase, partial [Bacilli bacterium]|nr:metallophosphoesterase [Bacilli bacterium]